MKVATGRRGRTHLLLALFAYKVGVKLPFKRVEEKLCPAVIPPQVRPGGEGSVWRKDSGC